MIQQLAYLTATRSRLLEAQKQLKTPLAKSKGYMNKAICKQGWAICRNSLESLEKDLKEVEKAIDVLISEDEELKRLFGIITSVKGVGKITAAQILITTNEFKDIKDPKKFACYSGVAPFVKESGLFKGKARVSHLANKKVKYLLHMSAMVAITYNEELKAYYDRKVNEEKKNKMLVLNAVRNKLILRIFSCVNQNRKYEENYTKLVA